MFGKSRRFVKIKHQAFVLLVLGPFAFWGMVPFSLSLSENLVFAQDRTTKEILNHISQLAEETGSYHAETIIVIEREGKRRVTKGAAKFKWPNMSWREIRKAEDGTLMGLVISNGRIKWNYIPKIGYAIKYNKETMKEDAQQKGWPSLDYFDKDNFHYIGKEQLAEEEMYVFEGKQSTFMKQQNPESSGNARVYISAQDGTIRKFLPYNKNGQQISSQIYSNIRKDPSISSKDFEFIPPKGTKIHVVKDVEPRINLGK